VLKHAHKHKEHPEGVKMSFASIKMIFILFIMV